MKKNKCFGGEGWGVADFANGKERETVAGCQVLPVDAGNLREYNESAGNTGKALTGKENEACVDVVDRLVPLTKEEREWILAVARIQQKNHSDVTYLLAALDELLESSEYPSQFSYGLGVASEA